MRQVAEAKQWSILQKLRDKSPTNSIEVAGFPVIDVSVPCTVIGGRNGAGKSRLLRAIAESVGQDGLLIDLHYLTEQALMILRSRKDFDEMADEFGVIGPDEDRLEDVRRVIGRNYEAVEWFALDVEPADSEVAQRFCWSGEQPLVPYFRVSYRGGEYTSRDMGLGEFGVHFVFWILEQYREVSGLTLLLDEPDAYLPPVGVSALLLRLLRLCREREWSMVVSTHSEELIKQAVEHDAFLLLQAGEGGEIVGTCSSEDARVAEILLARPPIRVVLFCEDETAYCLARALLEHFDRSRSVTTTLVWGNGDGYLRALHGALPRAPHPEIFFGYLFDGDQRATLPATGDGTWPAIALPTDEDPDTLFMGLAGASEKLAEKLAAQSEPLARTLGSLEGRDSHDWVNELAQVYGRQRVLSALADLWCDENPDLVAEFGATLDTIGVDCW